jgi:hypothetical protein
MLFKITNNLTTTNQYPNKMPIWSAMLQHHLSLSNKSDKHRGRPSNMLRKSANKNNIFPNNRKISPSKNNILLNKNNNSRNTSIRLNKMLERPHQPQDCSLTSKAIILNLKIIKLIGQTENMIYESLLAREDSENKFILSISARGEYAMLCCKSITILTRKFVILINSSSERKRQWYTNNISDQLLTLFDTTLLCLS